MGYVIEITDSKVEKMSDCVEEILNKAGEMMWMLEKLEGGSGWGEREGHQGGSSYGSRYGMRSRYDNYGQRGDYGYKDDEDWDDEEMMGERRRRSRRTGRYM